MTEYFWFVILAAVVVFLTFLIVPILFSIKDLKGMELCGTNTFIEKTKDHTTFCKRERTFER